MTDPIDPPPVQSKAKRRFSASRLQVWSECQQKAAFQYVDKLPRKQHAAATFGTCVHKGLELYANTKNLDLAVNTFISWWTHPEKHGIEPEIWPKGQTFGGYMAKGIAAIKDTAASDRWKRKTLIATEHPFLVPFGEFELTGFVDLIELAKDSKGRQSLQITDHKSSKKKPYVTNLKVNIQFSIYDYASRQPEFWKGWYDPKFPPMVNGDWWWEMTKDLPRVNIWHGVMHGSEWNAGERDQADFERLYRLMKQIDRALELEVYVPNISGDTCGICPYFKECRLPFNPNDVWDADVDTI